MRLAALLSGPALALTLVSGAFAEGKALAVLIVDRERVLMESAPAVALREQEQIRRVALRARFEETRKSLEAEEAEIGALRGTITAAEFEERVRAFDKRVREARRDSQRAGEAMQAEFAAARRSIAEALLPILSAVLAEHGASVIIDARTALIAEDNADVTAEVIARFTEVEMDFSISPPADGDGG